MSQLPGRGGGRRVFVGDIHGCLEPLRALLAALDFRPHIDRLLPAGDLVAKGPDSTGVLQLLREVGAEPVLGNYDLNWLMRGRIADPASLDWLAGQPVTRVFPDIILVHGGLHPAWTEDHLGQLDSEEINFAVNVRYCDPDGRRPPSDWPPPEAPFAPWDTFYRGDKRVVFGHWARRGLVRTERVIGLDSGCVYGRQLTAWIAEEDRLVQVPGHAGGPQPDDSHALPSA